MHPSFTSITGLLAMNRFNKRNAPGEDARAYRGADRRRTVEGGYWKLYTTTHQTGIDKRPVNQELLHLLRVQPGDRALEELLKEQLREWENQNQISGSPFWATNPQVFDQLNGEIAVGMADGTGAAYGIDRQEPFSGRIVISGRSGGGKSTLVILISYQLLLKGEQVIIVDLKKDFACLIQVPNFIYLPLEHYKENYLRGPEGISTHLWLNILLEIFAGCFDLRVSTRNLLTEVISALYMQYGYTGRRDQACPSLHDLQERLLTMKAKGFREAQYLESARNRIGGLISVLGPSVTDCSRGMTEELLQRSFALDLSGGIPLDYQNFVAGILSARLMLQRITRGVRITSGKSEKDASVTIVLDEVQALLATGTFGRGSYLKQSMVRGREFGIGMILACQHLQGLSPEVLANAGLLVLVGGLGTDAEYQLLAGAAGISNEKVDFLKKNQKVGYAVIRDLRYPEAFTAWIHRFHINKNVPESLIKERLSQEIPSLGVEERVGLSEALARRQSTDTTSARKGSAQSPSPGPAKHSPTKEVDQRARDLLMSAYQEPYLSLTEHCRKCGFSASVGQKVVGSVLESKQGLIHRATKRGGTTKVLEVIKNGYEVLGVPPPPGTGKGKGGFLHQYYVHQLRQKFFNQYTCTVELKVGPKGKQVDLGLRNEAGRLIGIEIELAAHEHVVTNVRKDLASGEVDLLYVAARDMATLRGIERLLAACEEMATWRPRLVVTLVSRLLNHNTEEKL